MKSPLSICLICSLSVSLVLFSAACNRGTDVTQSASEPEGELPESLQSLENLTVYPADVEPPYSIRFQQETTFEGGDVIAVDDSGRVLTTWGSSIYVYLPNGTHIETLGGRGEGPGEFVMGVSHLEIYSDQLYAYDAQLHRMNIYSLETLSHSGTILLDPSGWNHIEELQGFRPSIPFYVRSDRFILMRFRQPMVAVDPLANRSVRYYRMTIDGVVPEESDKIYEGTEAFFHSGTGGPMPLPIASPPLPSMRSHLMAVSEDGSFFSSWSEDFLVEIHDSDGAYVRSFYYPMEKSELNREDVLAHSYDRDGVSPALLRNLRNADFHETWPALAYMLIDDENRLWVATITEDEDHYLWYVVDEQGTLFAQFLWPGKRLRRHIETNPIKMVKNGYLYAHETEEETGLQQIVRYRIEMEGIE